MKEDGGFAFPTEQGRTSDGLWNQTYYPGMTLRDYFAGEAIKMFQFHPGMSVQFIAAQCYKLADAMLEERKK